MEYFARGGPLTDSDYYAEEVREDLVDMWAAARERYDPIRMIGEGRSGVVLEARPRNGGPSVALKLSWATDIAREWVDREGELTHRAQHPNVLPILASGRMADSAFHVTPIARSGTLGDVLADGHAVPLENAARMLRELAPALDAAHRNGIVHGCIRPEKIFVATNGQHFLGDFAIRDGDWASGRGTAPSVIGDPAHMPHEQRRDSLDIDGQVDQAALAVVLYEILTGRQLSRVTREGHLEVDSMDLAMARPIREGVPLSISSAIRRATAREPGARFANVGEFVNAALGLKETAPVAVIEEKKEYDVWQTVRWVAFATLAALAVFFFGSVDTRVEVQRMWRDYRQNGIPQKDFDLGLDPSTSRPGSSSAATQRGRPGERRDQSEAPGNTHRPGPSPSPAAPGDGSDKPLKFNDPPKGTDSPTSPTASESRRGGAGGRVDAPRQDATGGRDAPALDARSGRNPGSTDGLASGARDAPDARRSAVAPVPPTVHTAPGSAKSAGGIAPVTAAPTPAASAFVHVTLLDGGAAQVSVDGVSWGRTPLVWSGTPGLHRIEIRHIGSGLAASKLIRARTGDTVAVRFKESDRE